MFTCAVIIASGPSLTAADCDLVAASGWPVYAVNNAYKLIRPDILYAADYGWWDIHAGATEGLERWTINEEAAKEYGLNHVYGCHADSARRYFDASGTGVIYGGNSGFQTVNLAYMHGVRDAVLLGFDMGHEPDQPRHFFGEHPPSIAQPSDYASWIRHFNFAAPEIARAGMRVRNATRQTRLLCFERVSLGDALRKG